MFSRTKTIPPCSAKDLLDKDIHNTTVIMQSTKQCSWPEAEEKAKATILEGFATEGKSICKTSVLGGSGLVVPGAITLFLYSLNTTVSPVLFLGFGTALLLVAGKTLHEAKRYIDFATLTPASSDKKLRNLRSQKAYDHAFLHYNFR